MKALTLRHPWPWAIRELGKDVENRTWAPKLELGERFAIHAGRAPSTGDSTYQRELIEALKWMRSAGLAPKLESPRLWSGAVIAVATFDGTVTQSISPWFFGPIGWKLKDVVKIEPVACKGAQRLWTLPTGVDEQVMKQLRAA